MHLSKLPAQLLLFFVIFPLLASCQEAATGSPLYTGQAIDFSAPLTTIAVGSCNRQRMTQDMWQYIQNEDPDLWIWLGDNIYADTENMDKMEDLYRKQKFAPEYGAFRQGRPVIGVWDDHDYGVNDGGKEYPRKDESKALMLDFLDVPPGDPVRNRPGAYQSYSFGPAGQRLKVILLDTRYFRDPLQKDPSGERRYLVNENGDVLGEAQWAWLEAELRDTLADLILLGSSIQVIPEEQVFEKWGNFPAARQRLLNLIVRTRPRRVLLLSGDRHMAELSRMELEGLPYPLFELTSSGLTHSYEKASEPNRFRVGELTGQRNFGLLRIDWSTRIPKVSVEVEGLGNRRLIYHHLEW